MMNLLLASSNPLEHVQVHRISALSGDTLEINNHIVMQVAATVFCLMLIVSAFKSIRQARTQDDLESMVPKGGGNLFEAICSYLRDHVARPALEQHTDRFIPYIWSVFFFILFCNLFGLIPIDALPGLLSYKTHIGGTATGNFLVTTTLAICTLLMMVINGLRLGGKQYLAHFCPGPLWLAPLLVPVEIIGLFAKIFALAVRLFANMMAGHVLLAVLIGFATAVSGLGGWMIAVPSILGAAAITLLELFVAFLQAFIFTFLTCLFLGQSVVFHHEEHEHAEGAHKLTAD